jgi:hypothetical protein
VSYAVRHKGKFGDGPKTEKVILNKELSRGDANSADEGVKREGILKLFVGKYTE